MNERERENLLDQSLAATFPASDPVSITQPGGGIERRPNRPDALDRLLDAPRSGNPDGGYPAAN